MIKKYLYFILVLATGICFLMSALEVNTKYIHNTFDDDYDTYIQPDNSSLQVAVVKVPQIDLPEIISGHPFSLSNFLFDRFPAKQAICISAAPLIKPPDRLLLYRRFRI